MPNGRPCTWNISRQGLSTAQPHEFCPDFCCKTAVKSLGCSNNRVRPYFLRGASCGGRSGSQVATRTGCGAAEGCGWSPGRKPRCRPPSRHFTTTGSAPPPRSCPATQPFRLCGRPALPAVTKGQVHCVTFGSCPVCSRPCICPSHCRKIHRCPLQLLETTCLVEHL